MLNKFTMRNVSVLIMIIAIIGISGCKKPSTGTMGIVTLKFNPMFGSNNIKLFQTYTSPDGLFYNFQDFKIYLSHIRLMYTNGDSIEICPLAYFSSDDSFNLSMTANAPIGSYKGIHFNIGLDSIQNLQQPSIDTNSLYGYNHNTYWDQQNAFVFVEVDGTVGQIANSSNIFAYHVGTNPYYTSGPYLAKNFSVSGGTQTNLILTTNILPVFYGSANSINIITDSVSMTTGSVYAQNLAHTFMNNFAQTFTLQ